MREQAVTIFLNLKERNADARKQRDTERKATSVERSRDNADGSQHALVLRASHWLGEQLGGFKHQQQTRTRQRENHSQYHDAA